MRQLTNIFFLLLCALLCHSCIFIDDDLSDCKQEVVVNYKMKLVTNMQLELNDVLSLDSDSAARHLIREHLSEIFTNRAHDVDLWFYQSKTETKDIEWHRSYIIDDDHAELTIRLPRESYRHLAIANLAKDDNVILTDTLAAEDQTLRRKDAANDTIVSHTAGIFSARLDMDVTDSIDQAFEVNLYMVNSAMALVLDTTLCPNSTYDVFTHSTASRFMVNDSAFVYAGSPIVRADELVVSQPKPSLPHLMPSVATKTSAVFTNNLCFTTVQFPSDTIDTKDGYWQVDILNHMPDATITRTILTIDTPLLAGHLKVLRAQVQADGSVVPMGMVGIGATILLDWKQGNEHEIDF